MSQIIINTIITVILLLVCPPLGIFALICDVLYYGYVHICSAPDAPKELTREESQAKMMADFLKKHN